MLKKIAKIYLRIVEVICVALLCVILGCMCIQIFCRLLTIGQSFTEELSKICFCLLVFTGAPLALAEGADIAVDMVFNALPKAAQRILDIVVNLFIAVFAGFCIKSLCVFTAANVGVTAVSMTWIQMNWIYYWMMGSFGCLAVVAIVKAIAAALGKPVTIDINKAAKAKSAAEEKELDLGI